MVLKLGYSTCPNDTFIFEALVHNRVDTEGLQFNEYLSDVEELNNMAFRQDHPAGRDRGSKRVGK